MKHIRLFVATLAVVLGLAGGVVPVVATAASTPQETVCTTLGSNANCSKTPDGSVGLNSVVSATINILSIIVGIVAVIMIMLAGFKYITASGDSNKISSAKNTLIYAIVGLVIVALSQSLVKFVLSKIH